MPAPPNPLTESFAALLRWLLQSVDTHRMYGRFSSPMFQLISLRCLRIGQLVARVANGRFFPRRFALRGPRPRARPPPGRLPRTSGWLLQLVPETVQSHGHLEHMLRQPEMVALMVAAPVAMGRALRPLCRMLGVEPPPVIARPPAVRRKSEPAAPARQVPAAPERRKKPSRVRYVFGLRDPSPFPDPA